MANGVTIDALVPLMLMQLALYLLHQQTIMRASYVAQIVALNRRELGCMLCQVNNLLQLTLAEGALVVESMSDFGGEKGSRDFAIRDNGSLFGGALQGRVRP